MTINLGIWGVFVSLCYVAAAQTRHDVPQQVQYDDEDDDPPRAGIEPTYRYSVKQEYKPVRPGYSQPDYSAYPQRSQQYPATHQAEYPAAPNPYVSKVPQETSYPAVSKPYAIPPPYGAGHNSAPVSYASKSPYESSHPGSYKSQNSYAPHEAQQDTNGQTYWPQQYREKPQHVQDRRKQQQYRFLDTDRHTYWPAVQSRKYEPKEELQHGNGPEEQYGSSYPDPKSHRSHLGSKGPASSYSSAQYGHQEPYKSSYPESTPHGSSHSVSKSLGSAYPVSNALKPTYDGAKAHDTYPNQNSHMVYLKPKAHAASYPETSHQKDYKPTHDAPTGAFYSNLKRPSSSYVVAKPSYPAQDSFRASLHQDKAPQYEPKHLESSYLEPESPGPAYSAAPQAQDSYAKPQAQQAYAKPQAHRGSYGPKPTRDPKLPLYFTMYEKRVIQDPVAKYGKGPWRYLMYGHGITYGSKEPGKVFEKGYGYIRALGRDHCKYPDSKCQNRDDDKPFEYEGRKEPYFGYRPH